VKNFFGFFAAHSNPFFAVCFRKFFIFNRNFWFGWKFPRCR
jgi:hypothetical protein